MNNMDLDKLLADKLSNMPLDDSLVKDISPCKRSMKYILWGLCLSLFDVVIFYDFTILTKIIGCICLLIGFRSIRNENKYFKVGYICSIILNVRMVIFAILEMSIWKDVVMIYIGVLNIVTFLIISLLMYACLWFGIWNMENKAGKEEHSKSPVVLAVLYTAIVIMGLITITGIWVIIWGVAYICAIVGVFKTYKAVEEVGYVVKASSIKVPNWILVTATVTVAFVGVLVINVFNKYPMDWQKYEVVQDEEIDNMRKQLIEEGVPSYVVNDLSAEDIKQCAEAELVMMHEAEDDLYKIDVKIMSYAFCLDEEGRLKIINYFMWEEDTKFYGTELVTYAGNNVKKAENISGYVFYDKNETSYRAPYYRIEYVEEADFIISADVPAFEGNNSSLYTGFSYNKKGTNYRGYLTFETEYLDYDEIQLYENVEIKYWHQNWIIQYPMQTAWEYVKNNYNWEDKYNRFILKRNDLSLGDLVKHREEEDGF